MILIDICRCSIPRHLSYEIFEIYSRGTCTLSLGEILHNSSNVQNLCVQQIYKEVAIL